MSLKKNLTANYISQIYVTLIGIIFLPQYGKLMGNEAYGLVGFFAVMQSWFNLLDLGLTPTIGRETVRFKAGLIDNLSFRRLYRALSLFFVLVALVGGGFLLFFSSEIASKWLNSKSLPFDEIKIAIQIMSISVAMRWVTGLYRGIITGAEDIVWLSTFNGFIASVRFIGVLPVLRYFSANSIVFFGFQLIVAVIELVGLMLKAQKTIPMSIDKKDIGWSLTPIREVLKFALTIAFTSSVWVMLTQTDKLILSGILSLEEYGFFTLAVLVAGGIMVISGPVSNVLMSRMASLYVKGFGDEMIKIYRDSTQLVSIIAGSAAVTLIFCSKPLLFAWTGNILISQKAAPILELYAIGNCILVTGAFPYYLQYAKGDLRYHFLGNLILLVTLIPLVIFSTQRFGAIGAGYAWVFSIGSYSLFWNAYVHKQLEPGLHVKWLFGDIVRIVAPSLLLGLILRSVYTVPVSNRLVTLSYVLLFGGIIITFAYLFSTKGITLFSKMIRKVF